MTCSIVVSQSKQRKAQTKVLDLTATSLLTQPRNNVLKKLWVDVLIAHERMAGKTDPLRIAESILPSYLMRAVAYLEDNRNANKATDEIQQQFNLAVRQWNHEVIPH